MSVPNTCLSHQPLLCYSRLKGENEFMGHPVQNVYLGVLIFVTSVQVIFGGARPGTDWQIVFSNTARLIMELLAPVSTFMITGLPLRDTSTCSG